MNLFGSFLTFGAERAPEVVLLDQLACDKLEARINVAHGGEKIRLAAYEATFGKGVEYALPCWSNECMRAVALQYSGPHAEEVCRIAACIATGKPYSIWDEDMRNDGGDRDPVPTPQPRHPRGGGATIDGTAPPDPEKVTRKRLKPTPIEVRL